MISGEGSVAVVAIGRNEGERLKSCLWAALLAAPAVVYVDSGSTDGSAGFAHSLGCAVVELDRALPFTAARARNEGFRRLMELAPATRFVQFVDGDCALDPDWLAAAQAALLADSGLAQVRGQLRELHPEQSVYNRLCQLEWRQNSGEIEVCGGLFLIRAEVYAALGGMRPMIAGEDEEFSLRVRASGRRILMLDAPMATHDAAITRLSQWRRRMRRAGHAYAQMLELHPGQAYLRQMRRRAWLWGGVLPLLALGLTPLTRGWSMAVAPGLYLLQAAHIARAARRRGWPARESLAYAFFVVVLRGAVLRGMLDYAWKKFRGRSMHLIEYK